MGFIPLKTSPKKVSGPAGRLDLRVVAPQYSAVPIGAKTNAYATGGDLAHEGLLTLPPAPRSRTWSRHWAHSAPDILGVASTSPAPGADREDTWHMDKQDLEQIGECSRRA